MAKEVETTVKLQIPGGQATTAPPIGPALGQYGINIGEFTQKFNQRTSDKDGTIIPVEITIYKDRSFDFITKTPPASILLKQAAGIETASGEPDKEKVAAVSEEDVREIAETKMEDLNAASMEAAMSMVKGTARSMGIEVE